MVGIRPKRAFIEGAGMPLKRDWLDMTHEDFAGAEGWIAVLPVAAVEQHGPHLPVGTDTHIAEAYLARVRDLVPADLPVTFLPVQSVGTSHEHRAYPGTLTLSPETLIRALGEIGASVHRAGVRKLVIANSHGGNVAVLELVARDLRVRLGMLCVTCSWAHLGYPDGLFDPQERLHGIHAGAIETSMMLAARPGAVRADRLGDHPSAAAAMERELTWLRPDHPVGFGWMTQDLNPSGAVGDATQATAAKGEAALAFGARAFVELLAEVHRFDLAGLRTGPLGASSE
jgi:creatinine amidohydrolase